MGLGQTLVSHRNVSKEPFLKRVSTSFPSVLIYRKSFALCRGMEILSEQTDDSCLMCPCLWDLRTAWERCRAQ